VDDPDTGTCPALVYRYAIEQRVTQAPILSCSYAPSRAGVAALPTHHPHRTPRRSGRSCNTEPPRWRCRAGAQLAA